MPVNGSRNTTSTSSNTRNATRRSAAIQARRSSRNSGWKTASRGPPAGSCGLRRLAKVELAAQGFDGLGRELLIAGANECRDQPLGVLGRPQEVSGFGQTAEFGRIDKG